MSTDFIDHFALIQAPRIECCKKYSLMDILFLSICVVLSGAEGWEDIEGLGQSKLAWLRQFRPYEKGIPRHDTIARVMSRLAPYEVHASFMIWIASIV